MSVQMAKVVELEAALEREARQKEGWGGGGGGGG